MQLPSASQSRPRFDHSADKPEYFRYAWSPINPVAKKNDLPVRMSVDAFATIVAQRFQHSDKWIEMPMDIPDKIIHLKRVSQHSGNRASMIKQRVRTSLLVGNAGCLINPEGSIDCGSHIGRSVARAQRIGRLSIRTADDLPLLNTGP